eukprot:scaffold177771_cov33-Tisochrysis_lutea.AAC.2
MRCKQKQLEWEWTADINININIIKDKQRATRFTNEKSFEFRFRPPLTLTGNLPREIISNRSPSGQWHRHRRKTWIEPLGAGAPRPTSTSGPPHPTPRAPK